MWRVLRQQQRFAGPWRTLYVGNEAGARRCYADVAQRRQRGNLVLLHGTTLVRWSRRPQAQGALP